MKRWMGFGFIVIAGILAIVFAERQKVATQPGPQAVLSVTSDAERELNRIPANLDRMSDADEIRIGDELAPSYEAGWKADQGRESAKEVEVYIQKVGAVVSSHATRRLPYRFHYVPQASFVNAFAYLAVIYLSAKAC